MGSKIPDSNLGWHEPKIQISRLLDINERGYQFYKSKGKAEYNILILGGSVAFGAYASEISKTYFHIIGSILEKKTFYSDITIFASGAWKSIQELKAFHLYLQNNKPDLVIFLNGSNDLNTGATSKTLFGEKVQTIDGSPFTPLYHAHDYAQRVADYLKNMKTAIEKTKKLELDMLVVLQPSLVERKNKTELENILLKGSLKTHASASALNESYVLIRNGLSEQAKKNQHFSFLDCSKIFDSEKKTTFSDMWHFSDHGHEILGNAIASKILLILKSEEY